MPDEKNIIRRVQEGDWEAFAALYEEYFGRVYRYMITRVGSQVEAEDLTQQVFIKALGSIKSYSWRGIPFSSWLFRIAHNAVIDYYRKAARSRCLPLDQDLAVTNHDPVAIAEHRMDLEQLVDATKKLTEAQREAITLRFVARLSIAEVAKVMGKSQGAIKALQHSAIVALRKLLLREGP